MIRKFRLVHDPSYIYMQLLNRSRTDGKVVGRTMDFRPACRSSRIKICWTICAMKPYGMPSSICWNGSRDLLCVLMRLIFEDKDRCRRMISPIVVFLDDHCG